jgi:hypothetical protein
VCIYIYILILLFVFTVSCNSIQNDSRFNICCILCLKLYYNCNERWDFNKILKWIELLCIIVLYVYMFCYVNKIIETISCLFSLNWNRMLKQWRSINNYSTSRKKNTTSKQTLNIYILMNIHVFGLRQAYIFDRVKSVNVIPTLFPLVNWISNININRYKQANKKKKLTYISIEI